MEWTIIIVLTIVLLLLLFAIWPSNNRCDHDWHPTWSGRHGRVILQCRYCGKVDTRG